LNSADSHTPRISFLSWRQTLPAQVADWMIAQAGWDGEDPLDLSTRLVLVPTRQSGRRLREALAVAAELQGQAVFAPRVVVPESLPGEVSLCPNVATRDQILVAWMRVLLGTDPARYRAVFPVDPPLRDEAWARHLAERFVRVQHELAAGGLSMADVLRAPEMPESVRWRELAELERQFDAVLAEQDVVTSLRANLAGLASVKVPDGIEVVMLVGCPDPHPVAIQYLQALKSQVALEVLVYGPDEATEPGAFDYWGRPVASHWAQRRLGLTDFSRQVRLGADPSHLAVFAAERAAFEPRAEEWLNLTVVDPEIKAPLTRELEDRGETVFLPEGETWRKGTFYGLLEALAGLVDSADCRAVGNLLRCPDVLAALAGNSTTEIAADTLLRHWDRVRENHLVQNLDEAIDQAGVFPQLQASLSVVQTWVRALQNEAFGEVATSLPAEILGDRLVASDSELAEGVARWLEVVGNVKHAAGLLPALPEKARWELALGAFGEGTRFGHRPAGAIELGGWLEVLWADAPRMVIAGANEGRLPEAVSGDAFLPEALRAQLGLKTNGQRLAVDAYLMAAAVASRPEVDDALILVGKTAASGDPLRPSRILMGGDDAMLPSRVKTLFQPLDTVVDNLPWRRAWKLRPRRVKLKPSISVTGLRDWLECPFRFYLNRGLKMQEIELPKVELNAMDFGNLVHGVLEHVGRDPVLGKTTDEALLSEGMLADFEQRIRCDYGESPTLPLLIQFESARQRLRRVAAVEVAERQAGWMTERVEWAFKVPLGGLTITGKIDRIDRHTDGRVRVVDYKTSDKALDPLGKHLATLRTEDQDRPAWLRVMHRGKERRWIDLQLPLYRLALAEEFGLDLTAAYFNLPKAVGETGIALWDDPVGELQGAAETCAAGVAEAILREDFWPPVDHLSRYDDHGNKLFHHGISASVDETWIQAEVDDE